MTRFWASPAWRNVRWAVAGVDVVVCIDYLAAGRSWWALLAFSGAALLVWSLVLDSADDGAGA